MELTYYRGLAETAWLLPRWEVTAAIAAQQIFKNRVRYTLVEMNTGVPWHVVGGIHHMEADCDFSCHLANGDPLTARTVQVPAGLPKKGEPPFTWEQGALAALEDMGWVNAGINWSDQAVWLQKCEEYNGTGYLDNHLDVNTPYLWSGTSKYDQGKYVEDNKWDAEAVSEQVGLVAIWLQMGVSFSQYQGEA
jgi:lysozyme family protein